jgi:hypothetical protein
MLQLRETEKWCDWSANGSPQRWCRRRRFQTCLANGIISTGSRRERDGDKSVFPEKNLGARRKRFLRAYLDRLHEEISASERLSAPAAGDAVGEFARGSCQTKVSAWRGAQGDSTRLTSGRLPRPPGRRETTIGFGCTTTVRLLQHLSAGLGRLLWNSSSYLPDAAKQSASIEQILYEARRAHQLQAGDTSNQKVNRGKCPPRIEGSGNDGRGAE